MTQKPFVHGMALSCLLLSAFGGATAHADTLKTSGRFLYDPWGDKIVVRGVEANHGSPGTWVEIAKTGANYIRIFPSTKDPVSVTERKIRQLIRLGVVPNLQFRYVWNGDIEEEYAAQLAYIAQSKDALLKYDHFLTLHAMGEAPNSWTSAQWLAKVDEIVTAYRAAGFKSPLDVLSTVGGRNLNVILNNAQAALNFDPERNTIFGWQAYWGWNAELTANWYENGQGMTLSQALDMVAAQTYPIQVGLFYRDGGAYPWVDYKTIMTKSKALEIGWANWNWVGGTIPLSADGSYGNWQTSPGHPFGADAGAQITVNHAGSIAKTSVKTAYFQQLGKAPGLRATYFGAKNLTSPLFERVEEVDFNWASGSPSPLAPADHFSVRWEGQLEAPFTGTYTLGVAADDGVRLWFNNVLRIDEWQLGNGLTTHQTTVNLVKGQRYPIKLEYFENSGGARVRLLWKPPGYATLVVLPSIHLVPTTPSPVGQKIAIKSQRTGKYLTVVSANGRSVVRATASAVGNNEKFTVVNAGDGYVHLRSQATGKLLRLEDAGNAILYADGAEDIFADLVWIGAGSNNQFSLRAMYTEAYLETWNDTPATVRTNKLTLDETNTVQKFTWELAP